MAEKVKYYIVAADMLPESFLKVAEAKRLLRTGEARTVGAAADMVGISRSAYYKYRDALQPFVDMKSERIVTIQAMLRDRTGTLSRLLTLFAVCGVNILTINQSIPVDGCAVVNISAETSGMTEPLEQLMAAAVTLDGVVKFEILAG